MQQRLLIIDKVPKLVILRFQDLIIETKSDRYHFQLSYYYVDTYRQRQHQSYLKLHMYKAKISITNTAHQININSTLRVSASAKDPENYNHQSATVKLN